jgi:hypothetical protein
MDKEIIPYQVIDGRIYDFGILRITEQEQKQRLIDAASKSEFNNTLHIENHKKYETVRDGTPNGIIITDKLTDFERFHIYGYCKNHICKMKASTNVVHAAPYGAEVGYNCVDCLTKFIYQSRSQCLYGTEIQIEMISDDVVPASTGKLPLLSLTFVGPDTAQINNSNIVKAKWIPEQQRVIISEPLFIKEDPFNHTRLRTPVSLKKGEIYSGFLKGRYVCENVILGKQCLSWYATAESCTFLAKTVPAGVPGWREDHNMKVPGHVSSYKFCPTCALDNHRLASHEKKHAEYIKAEAIRVAEAAKLADAAKTIELAKIAEANRTAESPKTAESTKTAESIKTADSTKAAEIVTNGSFSEISYWKGKYSELQQENSALRLELASLKAQLLSIESKSRTITTSNATKRA